MDEHTTLDVFISNLLLWTGAALAWFGGESGRVLVAAGLGGFIRWIYASKKRIRDGVLAVVGGAVTGTYLWPAVLWILRMDETLNNVAMAAFIAGTLGVSFTKVLTAIVEARAVHLTKGP